MAELRLTVRNTSDFGGTATTPFYFGFHDGSFDLFNSGEAASPGLERLAEDGIFGVDPDDGFTTVAEERLAVSPDSQGAAVTGTTPAGTPGPIAAGTQGSTIVTINDGALNQYVSFGAMILPSNDAFVGTDDAIRLFDDSGRFVGAQTVVFEGSDVYDAGTEVNTELDAAFINQTAPDTGVDEGGVVTLHPGFNGSAGNPVGEGDQIILGGTNAFGETIDPIAADFTLPGAQIAEVHINTVVRRDGGDQRDFIFGRSDDDIVNAGRGGDIVFGGAGWDVINGEEGRDKIWGGRGNDEIDGGKGGDWIAGGLGDDLISGGNGRDKLLGGRGDDQIAGGNGDDDVRGGLGDDAFFFASGDDHDIIRDFDLRGDDVLVLAVDGVETFEDVLYSAFEGRAGTLLFFGDDSILLRGVEVDDLGVEDFVFA